MNSVIHAEMFFNNQRALAEQSKKLANPRKSLYYTLPFGDGEVKIDIVQIASFMRGEMTWFELDNGHMITNAIFKDWMELHSEK